MPTKRKRKHVYFTKEHEDAIILYNNTACPEKREELYRTMIAAPLSEMVDKIVYTYRFTTLPNIDELKDECKVWLTTVLNKYEPSKGSKAFSYFSVITKNWFIHKVKKTQKRRREEIPIEDLMVSGQEIDDKLRADRAQQLEVARVRNLEMMARTEQRRSALSERITELDAQVIARLISRHVTTMPPPELWLRGTTRKVSPRLISRRVTTSAAV